MFVALRDIRFAKGRFALIGAVVSLISGLVLFLYGLTAGLASDSSSALTGLPVRSIVFGTEVSFTNSSISAAQLQAWTAAADAKPMGVAMTRLSSGGAATTVSVLGVDSSLLPPLVSGHAPGAGEVAVSAKLDLPPGSEITIGQQQLRVTGSTADRSYGHAPSVWTNEPTWETVSGARRPSALAVVGPAEASVLDRTVHTKTVSRDAATAAIDGYSAEQGSLTMIQGFLFAISALVVGAFFTVWTVQRKPDIAVLKAIGASSGYLVRDALGQALVLLVAGGTLGAAAGVAGGAALKSAGTPFTLDAATVAVPLAAMIGLGSAGAALAVRRIVAVDPLTALGASR